MVGSVCAGEVGGRSVMGVGIESGTNVNGVALVGWFTGVGMAKDEGSM